MLFLFMYYTYRFADCVLDPCTCINILTPVGCLCFMFVFQTNWLGKPSFKKIKKIMENSIIGGGGSAMSNSIIEKNTVYFNTRPLFEAIE